MRFRFRDNRGSAMVELALTTPLFLLLIAGSFELGQIAYYAIEVQSASRAGASYGSVNLGNDSASTTAIQNAATSDIPDLSGLVVSTPITECVCETVSNGTTTFSGPLDCTTSPVIQSCTGSNATTQYYNNRYVKVDAQATVTPMIRLPGLPQNFTIHGSTRMRVLGN